MRNFWSEMYLLSFKKFYTRLFLRGLHPLWGTGVISRISVIWIPAPCNALIAVSRPEPGPLTNTAAFFIPKSSALFPAFSAATCAAKGVPFLAPLKPQAPAEDQDTVSPVRFVIVTIVLLKLDFIWATPAKALVFATFFVWFYGLLNHIC